jgi:dienelactone hydrolase
MHRLIATLAFCLFAGSAIAQSNGITQREVRFYSEGVVCYGKLYQPNGFSETSKVAAVVLAPGARQTAASLEKYAADIAAHGMLAMTFDYRGVGKSGGFLYFGEPVKWDDRLRFSQSTTKMRIRRKRLEPQLQVIDIRNAMTFVQGESGVDRARIGVWGTDLSGGYAVVVAGSDARAKAIVAQLPMLDGKGNPRKAFAPNAEQQAAMVKLARNGVAPSNNQEAIARNAQESKLAFAEYHPYWHVDQIAATTAVRFIISNVDANVSAASKVIKNAEVVQIPGDQATDAAIKATTEWFAKHLNP